MFLLFKTLLLFSEMVMDANSWKAGFLLGEKSKHFLLKYLKKKKKNPAIPFEQIEI